MAGTITSGGGPTRQPEDSSGHGCGGYVLIFLLVSAAFVVVTLLLLVHSPEPSTVEMTSIRVPVFKANLSYPEVQTYSKWEIELRIANNDRRWGARYEEVSCVLYKAEEGGMLRVGSAPVEPFGLGRREEKTVTVKMAVRHNGTMERWEFGRFGVRIRAKVRFETVGRMVQNQSVDGACTDIRMVFESNKLHQELPEPQLCSGIMLSDHLLQEVDQTGRDDYDLKISK